MTLVKRAAWSEAALFGNISAGSVMRIGIVDVKFKHDAGRYVLQCSLATLAILAVLLFLDVIKHTALIAALGATSFIAFTMPSRALSRPRCLIGGYLVGTSVGCSCCLLSQLSLVGSVFSDHRTGAIVFAALAVGLSIFLMVITDTEHAPAAGVALGLVLNEWDHLTVVCILCGVILLTALKWLLRPVLRDLL
jgi:CBS-domain-containing membrane protein